MLGRDQLTRTADCGRGFPWVRRNAVTRWSLRRVIKRCTGVSSLAANAAAGLRYFIVLIGKLTRDATRHPAVQAPLRPQKILAPVEIPPPKKVIRPVLEFVIPRPYN